MRLFSLSLFTSIATGFAEEPVKVDFNRYMEGKYVFERNCLVCHGARGDGTGELADKLTPRPRSFREGMFKFRTTPFGTLPTDDDLRRVIKGGLSGTAMGLFNQLSDDEVSSVIEYVKSFSRRWRKAENYGTPMKLAAAPNWLAEPEHIGKGKVLFATHCATCHGADADGKGAAAASLKDIWNLPAQPSDLRRPHLRCGDRPEDIFRVLATGLNGTPMLSFETTITAEQRWEIIAWIFKIKIPDGPAPKEPAPR